MHLEKEFLPVRNKLYPDSYWEANSNRKTICFLQVVFYFTNLGALWIKFVSLSDFLSLKLKKSYRKQEFISYEPYSRYDFLTKITRIDNYKL